MKTIAGFDYRAGRPVTYDRAAWRAMLRDVVAAGGRRRVEHGETFAHAAGGRMLFEVYGNIPAESPEGWIDA